MTRPVVIDVSNVSLAYKIYKKPVDLLWESLFGGVRHDTFWALKNVNLEVREGQRLGLVGPNGAGKSTLLQVITGNMAATTGKVKVNGKISSLLSLSPVWNAEDTGVENVKFNLMVQGVSAKKIPELTEEILEFTELGAAMYRPVKTFSSGMSARLAFAIATAADPEILIVDEVLGAGDSYFMGKAMRRMEEFCSRGKALLFVSHSTAAIRQFCDTAIWLENGGVRLEGDIDYVLKQYELDFRKAEDEAMRAGNQRDLKRAAAAFADANDLAWVQFRLMPETGDHFLDTHYVRSMRIEGIVEPSAYVNLSNPERITEEISSALDVFGSEWGRMYERGKSETRALAHAGGRDAGGRFRVRATRGDGGQSTSFAVDVESTNVASNESLALEYFDLGTAGWVRCTQTPVVRLSEGFIRQRFFGSFTLPQSDTVEEITKRIETANLPPVEIREVQLLINGERTAIVKEREPFSIEAKILFREAQPLADIGLKIIRSDGIYAYWQSSGQSGGNLMNVAGEKSVSFHFDPNLFGAGEYVVSIYVANGWDFPRNYPYARVFDRKVSALQFRIYPEFEGVDFGLLNQRAAVEVR